MAARCISRRAAGSPAGPGRPLGWGTSPAGGAHVTALVRDAAASGELMRSLGATAVAADTLDGQVELECSWRGAGRAIGALVNRRIGGKAVLHLD